jgi:hypothetical protein
MRKYEENNKKYSINELKKGDVMVTVFGEEVIIENVGYININPPLTEEYPVAAFTTTSMLLGNPFERKFNLALWGGYKKEDLPSAVGKGF